jgi:hypothetical protein
MIKSEKLDYESIAKALVDRNFYATCGPEIHELWVEDGVVHVKCSPAMRIEFVTGTRHSYALMAKDDAGVTAAEFEILPTDKYVRVTVTDFNDDSANTNAYFYKDLI